MPGDTSYSEKVLLEPISLGEESAFETLYDKYWKRVDNWVKAKKSAELHINIGRVVMVLE